MSIICQICQREFPNFNSLSKHIGRNHQNLKVEGYYLKYLCSNLSEQYCLHCNSKRRFLGLQYGFGAKYCNKCRKYDKEFKFKVSNTVKLRHVQGVYKNNGEKHKQWYNNLSEEEKLKLINPMLKATQHNKFTTGCLNGVFYRSSYEKKFIETYQNCLNYKIIKTNHPIHYLYEGEEKIFLLDFVLEDKNNNIIFVEVKGNTSYYQEEIKSNKARFKYGAAKRICEENGFSFWFLNKDNKKLYGCGECPACRLRQQGFEEFKKQANGE